MEDGNGNDSDPVVLDCEYSILEHEKPGNVTL